VALSRRTGRSRLTLALLILTSVTVLTLDFRDAAVVERGRELASSAFEPVRGAAESAFEPVSNAWGGITDYGDLEAENERLRRELDALEGERAADADAAEQLDDLLAQADIDWAGDVPTVEARVVSRPASNFDRTIDISKGRDHGIDVGMPVVTGRGLAGIVVDATGDRATVRLITDPDSGVGVRVSTGGALGTANGQGRDDELLVDTSIEPDTEIADDTLLTTSGADRSKYPPGIPVATVTRSREASNGLYLELIAEPLVDPGELSYVAVMQWP
jgi:rod shape-determining protein MreC